MNVALVVQIAVDAISLGALYALLALGLALVYSVLGLLNFAYGELITVCGYTMVAMVALGTPWIVAGLIGVVAAGITSVLIERAAFRPLRGATFTTLLFTSFAVSVILQNLARQVISPRPRGLSVPSVLDQTITVGAVRLGVLSVVTLAVAGTTLAIFGVVLQRTRVGLALRASAADFDVARLLGIRATRVILFAFAASGVVAGIAGVLWMARRGAVTPGTGFTPVLKAFIATVIGGLSDLRGAVLGGLALGALEVTLSVTLPGPARPFVDALALAVVVAVLYLRPQGFLGRVQERTT